MMGLAFIVILVVIVFAASWGSIFLVHLLKRSSQRLGPAGDDLRVTHLLEETENLARRLAIVEEELDFFKELRAPSVPERLPHAQGEDEPS